MNINNIQHRKIKYIGATNEQVDFGGHDDPRGILIEGSEYTLKELEVFNWKSNVILEEFPKHRFNSVCFDEIPNDVKQLITLHNFSPDIEKVFNTLYEIEKDINVMLEICRKEFIALKSASYSKVSGELTSFNRDLKKLRRKLAYAKLMLEI